jgi:hypothetical protein
LRSLKRKRAELELALTGQFTDHHGFLTRLGRLPHPSPA